MAVGIRGRPGKGSTLPRNVKLRPAPKPEDQAQPRRKRDSDNTFAVIPRQEHYSEEDEDEEDDGDGDEDGEDEGQGLGQGLDPTRTGNKTKSSKPETRYNVEEQRPLHGMKVCPTGTLEVSREDLRRMCETLGATFDLALQVNTTFLIADQTQGQKYEAAVENAIPVLRSSFLADLHARWISGATDLEVLRISENHRLAPLDGLTICLTGYDGARQDLRTNISALGGAAYSPALNSAVTHLVIGPLHAHADAADEHGHLKKLGKVDAARQINAKRRAAGSKSPPIHIVWGEWLEHSLVVFGRCKEALYDVELVPDRAALLHKRMQRPLDIVERTLAPSRDRDREREKDKRSGKKRASTSRNEGDGSRVLRQDTGLDLTVSNQAGEQQDLRSSKRARTAAVALTSTRASTSAAVAMSMDEDSRDDGGGDDGDQTDDGDSRGPSTSTKTRQSRSAGAAGAAIRKTRSRMKAGSERYNRSAEVSAVQELLAPAPPSAPVPPLAAAANADAVPPAKRRSAPSDAKGKSREPAENDTMHASALSTALVQPGDRRGSSAPRQSAAARTTSPAFTAATDNAALTPPLPPMAGSRLAKLGQSRRFTSSSSAPPGPAGTGSLRKASSSSSLRVPIVAPTAQAGPRGGEEGEEEEEEEGEPVQFLAGKVFCLCLPDAEAEVIRKAEMAVRRHGATLSHVDDERVDYVLCQFAKDCEPEYNPDDPRVVTDVWLEACLFHEKIMEEHDDEMVNIMRRPLRFSCPIPLAEDYLINYSGFDECASALCVKFCNALGIKHDKMMRKGKTTHLVIPNAEYLPPSSKRLGAAHDWGINIRLPHFLRQLAEDSAPTSFRRESGNGARVASRSEAVPSKEGVLAADASIDTFTRYDGESGQISGDVMDASIVLGDRDELRFRPKIDRPLQGCRIAIHRDVETAPLRSLVTSLGASYVPISDRHSHATHLVFRSKRLRDPNREFRAAQEAGRYIVHPSWLAACQKAGQRLPEQAYNWTVDASRSLDLALSSTAPAMSRSSSSTSARSGRVSTGGSRRASSESGRRFSSGTVLPVETAVARMELDSAVEDREEDLVLPPPLRTAAPASDVRGSRLASTQGVPRMSGIAQSTPRQVPPAPVAAKRGAVPTQLVAGNMPSSPEEDRNGHHRSSSATLASPPVKEKVASAAQPVTTALSEPNALTNLADDSGFTSASGSRKRVAANVGAGANAFAVVPTSDELPRLCTSSEGDVDAGGEDDKQTWQQPVPDAQTSSPGLAGMQQPLHTNTSGSSAIALPTNTALTRDLLAELSAMSGGAAEVPMQLNARLPYQQTRRGVRRPPPKKLGKSHSSPQANRTSFFAHNEPVRYEPLFESQFLGGAGQSQTQGNYGAYDQEDAFQESMIIRISDPRAEAAKASLLADIQRAQEQQEKERALAAKTAAGDQRMDADDDQTQKSL